ncbi:MAG: cyclic nucleotide-binding domain-containing protein [Deferrisomatales bacterium]|nr:cyclic nucleotide-binding domain-containing protein [Deferrisomatales bacterium]
MSVGADVCERMRNDLCCFLFLTESDVARAGAYFTCHRAPAGEVLWHEGDPSSHVVFILSGRLAIKKETEFPGRPVIVGLYGAGTIAGELCILTGKPRVVTAEVVEDASLLQLSPADFQKLVEDAPDVGVKLLKGMLHAVSIRLSASFSRLASIF